jgi:hypothetical protein
MKADTANYELLFGSNRILKCPRAVELKGKGVNKQIIRFREGEDGVVLMDCTVTDQEGTMVVKVANSRVQHLAEGYQADITGDGIKVITKDSKEVWLAFVKIGPRQFKLNGRFTVPGYMVVATDDYLEINTNRFSNNTFENCSAAIGLG